MRRHKRLVAVALSLGLHVLFFLFLMIRFPHGLSGGGFDGQGINLGDGMAVTLVDGEAMARMALTTKAPSEDTPESAIIPLQVDTATVAPLALAETQAMPQLIQAPDTDTLHQDSETQDAGRAGSDGDGDAGTAGDDLWSAVAPCWNRLADKGTLAVTLKISFDDHGEIASPPIIEIDNGQPFTSEMQRSEIIALQALAQCGAYTMVEGRQGIEVKFPKPE